MIDQYNFYWFTNSFLSSFEIIAVVLAVDDIVAPSGVSSTDGQASPFDRLRGGAFRDCPGCSLFLPWLSPQLLDPRASTSDAEIPRSLLSRATWNNAWKRRRRRKIKLKDGMEIDSRILKNCENKKLVEIMDSWWKFNVLED